MAWLTTFQARLVLGHTATADLVLVRVQAGDDK